MATTMHGGNDSLPAVALHPAPSVAAAAATVVAAVAAAPAQPVAAGATSSPVAEPGNRAEIGQPTSVAPVPALADATAAQVLAAQPAPSPAINLLPAMQGATQQGAPAAPASNVVRSAKAVTSSTTMHELRSASAKTTNSGAQPTGTSSQSQGSSPAQPVQDARGSVHGAGTGNNNAPQQPGAVAVSTQAAPQVAGLLASDPGQQTGKGAGSVSDTAARTPAVDPANPLPDAQASQSINSARVIQSMQGSEMRVGMHSTEFGRVSINTTVNRQTLAAEITFEHADLGRAISAHLPAIESRLSDYGMQARVEMRDHSMTPAHSSGSSQTPLGESGRGGSEARRGQGSGSATGGLTAGPAQGMAAAVATESNEGMTSSRLSIRI